MRESPLVSVVASLRAPVAANALAARRLTAAIALVGAGVCALSVLFVARSAAHDQSAARTIVELLVIAAPITAGVYAIRAHHDERFGLVLIGAGFAWSLTALGESSDSLPYSIGRVAGWLVFPSLFYLMLAFPEGRIAPGLDRVLFRSLNALLWGLYIGSALLVDSYPAYTPWATCETACPANAFQLTAHEPGFMSAVQGVRELLTVVLFAGVLISLLRRWHAATPLRRRTVGPVMVMSAVSIVVLAAFLLARASTTGADPARALGLLWAFSAAGIAAAFLVGLLRRRLWLGDVLARLAERLSGGVDLPRLRDALAYALSDPTLEVLVPEGPVRWRSSDGHVGGLPVTGPGRELTLVRDGDTPGVALVHDSALRTDDELFSTVGALVLGTVRHNRVTSRLATALGQLDQSRRRIAEAADEERARIERDLHDGAQQRLMMLRIRLSLAEELLDSDPAAGMVAVRELGAEVERTLDELRALAHGVYPAILNDRGLVDALRSLATEVPQRAHVQARGVTRLSREIETAVYFTCAEAVQNTVKHAPTATNVWITISQGAMLTLEVRDDGPGFTPLTVDALGAHDGLRNMRDRLEAVGGRFTIDSAPGRGTRMTGVVPLA